MEDWTLLYGAAIGDVCGSIYERKNHKTDKPEEIDLMNPDCFFTDDTVLTAAIADAIYSHRRLASDSPIDYKSAILRWARKYPNAGYGKGFKQWMRSDNPQPYNSYGNGSAMRVSPIGWLFDDEETVLEEAKRSAEPTHNHPEGIKGAQAVVLAVFLARNRADRSEIKERIEKDFGYDLSRSLAEIRPTYRFDSSCQGSVPVAIAAFLESRDFESAIQKAISVGGDSDTLAAIAGSIAAAHFMLDSTYDIPSDLYEFVKQRLPLEIQQTLLMQTD